MPIGFGRHGWAHETLQLLIPARTRQTTGWGRHGGKERQRERQGKAGEAGRKDRKGDIKGQEPGWVQGTGSARFARLGTPSDPSRTAQKCICAGSPCQIARPKYRYHRRQQEPTCANPPARRQGRARDNRALGSARPSASLPLISTQVHPVPPSGLNHICLTLPLPCSVPAFLACDSWVVGSISVIKHCPAVATFSSTTAAVLCSVTFFLRPAYTHTHSHAHTLKPHKKTLPPCVPGAACLLCRAGVSGRQERRDPASSSPPDHIHNHTLLTYYPVPSPASTHPASSVSSPLLRFAVFVLRLRPRVSHTARSPSSTMIYMSRQ